MPAAFAKAPALKVYIKCQHPCGPVAEPVAAAAPSQSVLDDWVSETTTLSAVVEYPCSTVLLPDCAVLECPDSVM